ncbi:MAG: ABC transporter permease [Candidatus Hermodarchaeota archaeon]
MNIFVRVFKASLVKETKTWLRNKSRLIFIVAFPLLYYSAFLLLMGGVYAGPGVDAALVVQEDNPGYYTNGLIEILGEPDEIPPSLNLMEMDSETASLHFENGDLYIVITIPDGFEAALANNESVSIQLWVNNAHEDMTKNLRMPVIRKLDIFYQTYLPGRTNSTFEVELLNPYTPPRLAYMAWTVTIFGISFAGFYLASSATASEFEHETLEEITLSNQSPHAIYAGKMFSAVILSYLSIPVVFLLGLAAYGVWPMGNLAIYIAMTLLLATLCSGIGVVLGAIFRNSVYVVPVAALGALFYWLTGGGIAPLEMAGIGFVTVNEYLPFSNAYRTLIEMFIQGTYSTIAIDFAVVGAFAVAFVLISPMLADRLTKVDFGRRLKQLRGRRQGSSSHG